MTTRASKMPTIEKMQRELKRMENARGTSLRRAMNCRDEYFRGQLHQHARHLNVQIEVLEKQIRCADDQLTGAKPEGVRR